jgi:hypothetical protein
MPVTFDIREDGFVAYYTVTDPWTTNEFIAHYPEDIKFRTSVSHPVHWVLDFQGTKGMPPGILRARSNSPLLKYPRSGHFYIIGAALYVRTIAETILRLVGKKEAHFFNTFDEARSNLDGIVKQDSDAFRQTNKPNASL